MVYVLVVAVDAAMSAPAVVAVLGAFPVLGEFTVLGVLGVLGVSVTLGLVPGDLLAAPAPGELVAAE